MLECVHSCCHIQFSPSLTWFYLEISEDTFHCGNFFADCLLSLVAVITFNKIKWNKMFFLITNSIMHNDVSWGSDPIATRIIYCERKLIAVSLLYAYGEVNGLRVLNSMSGVLTRVLTFVPWLSDYITRKDLNLMTSLEESPDALLYPRNRTEVTKFLAL